MVRGISIRDLQTGDLSAIGRLGSLAAQPDKSGLSHLNVDEIASILAGDGGIALVALQGKKHLGFLIASVQGHAGTRSADIICMIVRPDLTGMGIEEKLLKGLITEMKQRGLKTARAEVPENDSWMISVMEKSGYAMAGRRILLEYHAEESREGQ